MCVADELATNSILNEINDIIWDDNLSDMEALEEIILVLKRYTESKEVEAD